MTFLYHEVVTVSTSMLPWHSAQELDGNHVQFTRQRWSLFDSAVLRPALSVTLRTAFHIEKSRKSFTLVRCSVCLTFDCLRGACVASILHPFDAWVTRTAHCGQRLPKNKLDEQPWPPKAQKDTQHRSNTAKDGIFLS